MTVTTTDHDDEPMAWRDAPIDRHGWLMMLATFVVGSIVSTAVGLAVVHWWEGSALGREDADINRWLEDHRTPTLDTVAIDFSHWSDPPVKVLLGLAMLPVMLWLFRRWHEWALVVGGLVVEVSVFGLSSELVGRDRPPVEQLDGAPTNSFPSGHIAACTVFYTGLAVVIFMQTRHRGPRIVAAVIGVGMPIGMVLSRMYLGMHYLTDSIAGLVLGVVVLIVMYGVIHRTLPADESPEQHDLAADRRSQERAVGAGGAS